jgi:organic radical activating enzyme
MVTATKAFSSLPLNFLWLELTNACNEHCPHCYNRSGPQRRDRRPLGRRQWQEVLEQAAALGCSAVQFVGGEPLKVRFLPELVKRARSLGFRHIEIFTNATLLDDRWVDLCIENGVQISTTVYSDDPAKHDAVTGLKGSHARTIGAIKKLVAKGAKLKVAVIKIADDPEHGQRTVDFVHALGVDRVGMDRVRGIGRGMDLLALSPADSASETCGECWKGKACVAPNGTLYPCVMSRHCAVGSVRSNRLGDLIRSEPMGRFRAAMYGEQIGDAHGEVNAESLMALIAEQAATGCDPSGTCQGSCTPNGICCTPCGPVT